MKRTRKGPLELAVAIGLTLGLAAGYVAGLAIHTDNMPFFLVLGALVGLCGGLAAACVFFAVRR